MFHSFVSRTLLASGLLLVIFSCCFALAAQTQVSPRSPSDTVREFYKAMRARKFREAFAMSIYKPAIEGLKSEEFEDLRPDFEKMAAAIPDQVDISGEQTSGDVDSMSTRLPAKTPCRSRGTPKRTPKS